MLNKELIKELAQKIDDMVDWVKITGKPILGKGLEIADNYALPWGLNYLNVNYGDKIPVQFVDEIEAMLTAFIANDYAGVLNAIPEGFDEAIDIKFFEDDFEAVWLATNFNGIVKAITYYSKRRLAA